MPQFRPPKCQAPLNSDESGERRCNREMKPMGERNPSFGPNWRPGAWVFECLFCGAIRAIETEKAARYTERIK